VVGVSHTTTTTAAAAAAIASATAAGIADATVATGCTKASGVKRLAFSFLLLSCQGGGGDCCDGDECGGDNCCM
jgi:hypothetical protein